MNKWWKELNMKIKIIISIVTLCSMLSGVGFSVYSTFAKETEFKEFVAGYEFDRIIKRANWLDEKVWKCRERYGDTFEEAEDDMKEVCRGYKRELKRLEEKIKKGG